MNKTSIKHTKKSLNKNQLAAGFIPFKRGYLTNNFNIEVVAKNEIKKNNFYEILEFSVSEITSFCNQFTSEKLKLETNPTIPIKLNFNGSVLHIASVRAIRTLLAFICDELFNDASKYKFKFYVNISDQKPLLAQYINAQIAQIDVLLINETISQLWESLIPFITKIPVDAFFGSQQLEQLTESVFVDVYEGLTLFQR